MVSIPYIITPAEQSALDVSACKKHLGVFHFEDDVEIAGLIQSAEAEFTKDSGRVLYHSTWEEAFECWPEEYFELSRYPVSAISSITYTLSDGTTGTVSSSLYHLSTAFRRPRIYLKYSQTWPSVTLQTGPSIRVRFTAGSTALADSDQDIVAALKVRIGDRYSDKDGQSEMRSANPLIGSDRVWRAAVQRNRIEA